jgi:cysteine desulfurase/selenocysteine lyase
MSGTISMTNSNPAGAAALAAVPDAALIAAMANAFFTALPGQPVSVPASAAPAGATPPAPSSVGSAPWLGAAPVAPGVPVAPPAGATRPSPPSPFSGEAELGALLHSLGGALSLVPQSLGTDLPVATPAVPTEGYYFLDEVRSATAGATRVPTVPALPATPATPGLGLDLGLLPAAHRPEAIPDLGFAGRPFDPRAIRRDFPILDEQVHGKSLIWLDNAATTQKPQAVIDRLSSFYQHENSNIHRGAHALAARATDAYEAAREKTRRFLGAASTNEIVFVRGATEGINLVAQAWGRRNVGEGDEIVVTWLEHHANIVPWQQLAAEKGARLRVAPVDDSGQVILEEYDRLLNSRTRIVSFTHVSNALGTVTPAREMVAMAHRHGARVLVDGAQAVSHMGVNVQELDCDFYVFSGHKVFAPTGIGVVYGKEDLLNTMPPWQGGGNMIVDVTFEKTVYQPAPFRFEAGTGNIADAAGLGAAIDYLERIGMENISRYEHELLAYATRGLLTVPGLSLIGTAREKAGVLSFVLDGFRSEDVGRALDQDGIAVRSGHHCAQPILRRFGLESTVRPSLALYNTCDDIDALVVALLRLQAGRGHRGL